MCARVGVRLLRVCVWFVWYVHVCAWCGARVCVAWCTCVWLGGYVWRVCAYVWRGACGVVRECVVCGVVHVCAWCGVCA